MANGILIAAMKIGNAAEDEFHDWYDTEHLPERERVSGFLACRRWIAADDRKISVATYDLDTVAVLRGAEYRAIGGENLSPLEVENLLRRHAKVADACVVGVPDTRLGEVCMAFVQLRPGCSAEEAEIVSFCRDHIAGYKVPRHVRFVDGFPMTGNNKIRRVEVKELARRSVGA